MRPGPQEAEASSFEVQMLSRLEAIETALAHITAMPDRAQLDDLSTRPAHSDLAEPKCPEWKRVHAPRRRAHGGARVSLEQINAESGNC